MQVVELLTKSQLAKELQVSSRTVSNWTSSNTIPYFKIGRVVRFNRAEVYEALNAYRVEGRSFRASQSRLGELPR